MEKLEQQKEILELGKILVKELGLVKSVDTLSRWMAHYIAQKIKYAESLPDGLKKRNAQEECSTLILDLWKHRWHYKNGLNPLRNFNELFKILENLSPEKAEPFYYRLSDDKLKEESSTFDPSKLIDLAPLALQIDKVARIWINYLLHDAAKKAKNKKIEKFIDLAVKIPDSMDANIIQIVFSDQFENENAKKTNKDELIREDRIKKLKKRIQELEKFKAINEYLISKYESEINNL